MDRASHGCSHLPYCSQSHRCHSVGQSLQSEQSSSFGQGDTPVENPARPHSSSGFAFNETPPTNGHLLTMVPSYHPHDIPHLKSWTIHCCPFWLDFSPRDLLLLLLWDHLGNLRMDCYIYLIMGFLTLAFLPDTFREPQYPCVKISWWGTRLSAYNYMPAKCYQRAALCIYDGKKY